MNDTWSLIDAIAAGLGVSKNNRRIWRQKGVPAKYHFPIIEEARRRRKKLTVDDLKRRYAATRFLLWK